MFIKKHILYLIMINPGQVVNNWSMAYPLVFWSITTILIIIFTEINYFVCLLIDRKEKKADRTEWLNLKMGSLLFAMIELIAILGLSYLIIYWKIAIMIIAGIVILIIWLLLNKQLYKIVINDKSERRKR